MDRMDNWCQASSEINVFAGGSSFFNGIVSFVNDHADSAWCYKYDIVFYLDILSFKLFADSQQFVSFRLLIIDLIQAQGDLRS